MHNSFIIIPMLGLCACTSCQGLEMLVRLAQCPNAEYKLERCGPNHQSRVTSDLAGFDVPG